MLAYMFDRMGHARDIGLVTEVSHIDVKGCAGLVGLGVVDQKSLELIVETDDAIVAIIEQGLLEGIGEKRHGGIKTARGGGGIFIMLRVRHCGCFSSKTDMQATTPTPSPSRHKETRNPEGRDGRGRRRVWRV